MKNKLIGLLLLGLATVLLASSLATAAAALYSLTLKNSVAALELAFGTLVAFACLALLAIKTLRAGIRRLSPPDKRG